MILLRIRWDCLRRGLRLKDGPGSARAATVSVGLRQGFILSPSARTGPSRLGPAGEGRSDGGVLHLHPRGQARYPEGGRRREDEPLGEGWRIRAKQETTSTRATSTWRTVTPGLAPPCPPCMAPVAPLFHPLPSYADAAGSSLHQRGGTPHPHGWRAISVSLAAVSSGLLRSLPDISLCRSSYIEAQTVQLPKLTVRGRTVRTWTVPARRRWRASQAGIHRRSSDAASLARHDSSMKQGKVSMVKARLARWVSRWRERRLAREQTRQTPAARQAARTAEGQRYHSTGHGP